MSTTKHFSLLILAITTFQLTTSSEYVFSDQQTPAFKDYEMFQDIFPLTRSNFSRVVLRRPDPWVIIFHTGMLDRGWKSMAVGLRGVVWVGMIDVNSNEELLQEIDYSPKNDTAARVYTYGNEKSKLKSWRRVSDPNTARSKAVGSLPDLTLKMTLSDLEDFIIDSFMSKPSRFPAIFLTDEKDTTPMMKALALRFKKYFNFGKIVQPSLKDLGPIGMQRFYKDMPALVILTAQPGGDMTSPKFNALPFDKKTMGDLSYPNVLAFLFSVNREFRHMLPGENLSNEREAVEMDEILKIESVRFDVKGLKHPTQGKKVMYEELHDDDDDDDDDDDINLDNTIVKNRISDEL